MAKITKKKIGPRTHKVVAKVPGLQVGNADICFVVSRGGSRIGTFQISRGNVEFIPSSAQPQNDGKYRGYKVKWEVLAEMLQETTVKRITKKT